MVHISDGSNLLCWTFNMRCTRCLFEAARSLRTDKLQTYILGEASPYVRPFNSPSPPSDKVKTSFRFFPRFFTPQESREVLTLALLTLDRRRRVRIPAPAPQRDDLQDLFRGEYPFEQAHFDSVIHNYRECLITKHPPAQPRARLELFERLYALLPEHKGITGVIPKGTYTHALHLAPEGKIDAHVDNLEASGSCIIGASLGGERILRLEKEGAGWEVLLPSGSVYVQQYVTAQKAD